MAPKNLETLVESCKLDTKDFEFFEDVATKNNMSGRGIMRVLKVARTIADIDTSERVSHEHLCEALTYRIREKDISLIEQLC